MSNGIVDVLPVIWYDCALKEQVIEFFRAQPIPEEDRKVGFLAWCRFAGCDCTAEDYRRATGTVTGEIP